MHVYKFLNQKKHVCLISSVRNKQSHCIFKHNIALKEAISKHFRDRMRASKLPVQLLQVHYSELVRLQSEGEHSRAGC